MRELKSETRYIQQIFILHLLTKLVALPYKEDGKRHTKEEDARKNGDNTVIKVYLLKR